MLQYTPFVAGNFIQSDHLDQFIVYDKFSAQPLATVYYANETYVEKAITEAFATRSILRDMSSSDKSNILKAISDKLFEFKKHFATIIAQEAGKPLKYALIEAERAAQVFLVASEEARRFHGELLSLDWFPQGLGKEAIIKYFPVGVVVGITPFNFPLNLVAHKIAPALAAGCPFILKPASSTPLSALELARIIQQTDLPDGALSVLPLRHQDANPLIEDERISKISFTGSPEVGWKLKQQCGRKKITLELGGNAAAIVTESCNFNEAVNKCVTGAFAYSGQICIHTQRIFVHHSIYDSFLKAFVEKTKNLKYGNPLDPQTDISVMIDEQNAIRVEQWVNEAIQHGAQCVIGGKRHNNYYEPTVLINTTPLMKIWQEEIFGPVVLIEPYNTFDDAISMVNDSRYGLQAGVFTNNISEMNTAFRHIETGAVLINESPTFRIDHMPYGGIKLSGFGREGIRYAMHEMSELKILLKPM